MTQKLTNEKARELLKELQYAKVQMGGQLSIRDEYFKQALEDKLPRWIACSEQMPEKFISVLIVATNPKEVLAAYLNNYGEFCFDRDSQGNEEVCTATHWMPLPEAP